MSFASMHNDYLDPDRHLNQDQAEQLHDGCTIKGYGRTQHGLNGKDADLDYGGQITVKEVWWLEDGTITVEGRRYASICPGEDFTEEQMVVATEIVCGCEYPGEWDGDNWIMGEDFHLKLNLDWIDRWGYEANLNRACRFAYRSIKKDSAKFEEAMTELAKSLEKV